MEHCSVPFWEHQKKMFIKCKDIEKNSKVGVMADRPGSGKTYVSLAIISDSVKISRKEKMPNIIVVAENIYLQWIESIKKFNNLKFKKFIEYGDTSMLFFNNNILLENDILLTTPLYFNIIAQNMKSMRLKCYRLIVDEIDSVINILNENLECKYKWIISGTFLTCTNYSEISKVLKLPKNLKNVTCKFDDDVYKSIEDLEDPLEIKHVCKDVYLDKILYNLDNDLFSVEELEKLNALDFEGFGAIVGITKKINSIKQATKYFIDTQRNKRDKLLEDIELTKKNIESEKFELDILESKKNNLSKDEFDKLLKLKQNLESLDCTQMNLETRLKEASDKYKRILDRVKNENMCMICYSDENNELLATDCCHSIYCKECLKTWLHESDNCPYCKTNICKIDYDSDEEKTIELNDYKLYLIEKNSDNINKIIKLKSDNYDSLELDNLKKEILEEIKNKTDNFKNIDLFSKDNINQLLQQFGNLKKEDYDNLVNNIHQEIEIKISNLSIDEAHRFKFLSTDLEQNKNKLENIIKNAEDTNNRLYLEQSHYLNQLEVMNKKFESEKNKTSLLIGNEYNLSKIERLVEIISNLNDEKKIIFSNHTKVFSDIIYLLKKDNIEYIEIDTAEINYISERIEKFKTDKKFNILMADSIVNGAGLNLEFTDTIIMMHKMSTSLEKQLIARAQRPGRKNQLKIYRLYHLNEEKID